MGRGCLGLLILLIVLLVCLGVALVVYMFGTQPNTIQVQVVTPATTASGGPFTIDITIENVSLEPVTVASVGLDENILRGAEVVSSQPSYSSIKQRDYPYYGGWNEFMLDTELAPGETLMVTFNLQPKQVGSFSGDVTVWIEDPTFGLQLNRARREAVTFQVQ